MLRDPNETETRMNDETSAPTGTERKRFSFLVSERTAQMIEEIKVEKGFTTATQVFIAAIAELHRKALPAYAQGFRGPSEPKLSKEESSRREGLRICKELDGRVDGNHCVYYKYAGKARYEQKIPLNLLSDEMVRTQYSPNRARIEELRAAKMTDY